MENRRPVMGTVENIQMVILVGVWLALNISLIRDWIARRNTDGRETGGTR